MTDSYLTISTIAEDQDMIRRVQACAAQQDIADERQWTAANAYKWASSPTWAEKWDYAVNTGVTDPGADPAVITDGDILSTVQGLLAPS